MKISYNWLKDHINTSLNLQSIGEILTDTGLEVEKIEEVQAVKGGLKGIVVGQVIEKLQHPNADRLSLTKVDIGLDKPLQVVCGAPNVAENMKVAVCTVGTTLYPKKGEPFKIKKGKIRGEVSEGMLCSEEELGLGESNEGIMDLEDTALVGVPLAEHLNLNSDYSIEIGLTPNRTDAMSHFGVARDLHVAIQNMKGIENSNSELLLEEIPVLDQAEDCPVQVEIIDSELCPRYSGVVISGVEISSSPDWIQDRLRTIGLEPINNVVDITNYVLHELGHPLHAFDLNKIEGNKIKIQCLKEGVKFSTLDGVERNLSEKDLMICDANDNPLCIAGVFGGDQSGVSESTKDIFLECAAFDPVSIRKSAKRHQLSTDASFRFERGINPDETMRVLAKAANMISDIAGGKILGGAVDKYENQREPASIRFSPSQCNTLIGVEIPKESMMKILEDLDFQINDEGDTWNLIAPKYRVDVTRSADVVEEILRIYGYNNIPLPKKLNSSLSYFSGVNNEALKNKIAEYLASNGFNEIMNNSLTAVNHAEKLSFDSHGESIELLNPLSSDLGVLRTGILHNMLEVVSYNFKRKSRDLKLFELGNIYFKTEEGRGEELVLGITLTGRKFIESWNNSTDQMSNSELLGVVEQVLRLIPISGKLTQDKEQVLIHNKKKLIASMRLLSKEQGDKFDLDAPVYCAVIYLDRIFNQGKKELIKYETPSKFPEVRRDLSLLLDQSVRFVDLKECAEKYGGKLLKHVSLFDVYEGKGLEQGKKSYSLRFVLSDSEKTLNDKVIDKTMNKIITALQKEYKAALR